MLLHYGEAPYYTLFWCYGIHGECVLIAFNRVTSSAALHDPSFGDAKAKEVRRRLGANDSGLLRTRSFFIYIFSAVFRSPLLGLRFSQGSDAVLLFVVLHPSFFWFEASAARHPRVTFVRMKKRTAGCVLRSRRFHSFVGAAEGDGESFCLCARVHSSASFFMRPLLHWRVNGTGEKPKTARVMNSRREERCLGREFPVGGRFIDARPFLTERRRKLWRHGRWRSPRGPVVSGEAWSSFVQSPVGMAHGAAPRGRGRKYKVER